MLELTCLHVYYSSCYLPFLISLACVATDGLALYLLCFFLLLEGNVSSCKEQDTPLFPVTNSGEDSEMDDSDSSCTEYKSGYEKYIERNRREVREMMEAIMGEVHTVELTCTYCLCTGKYYCNLHYSSILYHMIPPKHNGKV